MTRAGSCQCGHVRYEVSGPDIGLVLCYCTECQRLSTGIGTYSMVFPRGAFRLISGSLKSHERAGHAGTRNVGHFCPECGVRIYHEDPHQDYVRLKAGTLNHASELEPDAHIWTRSAPAWVRLPDGCLSYETQAEPAEMITAVQARRARAPTGCRQRPPGEASASAAPWLCARRDEPSERCSPTAASDVAHPKWVHPVQALAGELPLLEPASDWLTKSN